MSMLSHRNTRALLVPVLCIFLLMSPPQFANASTPTTLNESELYTSINTLAQQQPERSSIVNSPLPSVMTEEDEIDSYYFATTSLQQDPDPVVHFDQLNHGDSGGVVPRKFTVAADPSATIQPLLPARPQAAALADERRLIRRGMMLSNSGVTVVDTMVFMTVDGRIYGVSRFDGSIVWERDCLLDSTSEDAAKCPREMVWTKSRSRSLRQTTAMCPPHVEQEWNSGGISDYNNEDGDYGEEEWLLEQGIDWRSDPSVLKQQREQRQAWLDKQRQSRDSFTKQDTYTEEHDQTSQSSVLYIAEPGDSGALYMYSAENGLKKLPLTIEDMVEKSPIQVRGSLYTGSKTAGFASIDVTMGRLLNVYGDEQIGVQRNKDSKANPRFSGRHEPVRVLLGEKLNHVRIYPVDHQHERGGLRWELCHRSMQAPILDSEIDMLLAELSDGVEALGTKGHGPTKFVMTQDGGFVMIEASTGMPLWAQEFDAPVAAVFDIFGIAASGDNDSADSPMPTYVARKRELSPAAQQRRYQRWRQLHEVDEEDTYFVKHGHGSRKKSGEWLTGSSGGNVLAESFWERKATNSNSKSSSFHATQPHIAYIGKLRDTLYTLTGDEFPLIDHATLTSSLLLALVQARGDHARYTALRQPEWWERWKFLTHDPVVLRVLQDAQSWWQRAFKDNGSSVNSEDSGIELAARLDQLAAYLASRQSELMKGTATASSGNGDIIGIHPVETVPGIGGALLHRPGLPDTEEAIDNKGESGSLAQNDDPSKQATDPNNAEKKEKQPWWRVLGHYITRVAAVIGFVVTITVLVAFVGAIYLLRPRNKRRPRLWIGTEEDDGQHQPGRRERLKISWALMHRMWATLKEEWRAALEEAWRNPNAAELRRRLLRNDSQASLANVDQASRTSDTPSPLTQLSQQQQTEANGEVVAAAIGSNPSTPINSIGSRKSNGAVDMITTTIGSRINGNQIGAITITDEVLGYGSHGTVVCRGQFQGRDVAIKRLLVDFFEVADREVQIMQESDSHPNVIRYYCTERHGHFMYIALELCCGSLADAISLSPKAQLATQMLQAIPKQEILLQLARGLQHLHSLKLVHRDIKPQNILIALPPHRRRRKQQQLQQENKSMDELAFEDTNIVTGASPRILISDFGLSRILEDDESSFANTFTTHAGHMAFGAAAPPGMLGGFGGGTIGWRAPETFDSPEARSVVQQKRNSVGTISSTSDHDNNSSSADPPSWPSLRPRQQSLPDDPSPFVSRGTRSRLKYLSMTPAVLPNGNSTTAIAAAVPANETNGDDPDSTGTSLTNPTDNGGSMPYTDDHSASQNSRVAALASSSSSRRRMTRAVDIFSIGCVFYYVLMDGQHPFGDRLTREQRILEGMPNLRSLEASDNLSAVEAVDLIAHMVTPQARDRPSINSVIMHPYFWDATRRLSFLQDVSDCLEAEARLIKTACEGVPEPPKKQKSSKKKGGKPNASGSGQPSSHVLSNESIEDIIAQLPSEEVAAVRRAITLLDSFEEESSFVMEGPLPSEDGFQVVGSSSSHSAAIDAMSEAVVVGAGDKNKASAPPKRAVAWDRRLDYHLRRDLGKFRKYDGTRLRDLLRIIRNKKNHYQDMAAPLREILGDIPDGYLHYFESRFPYLLLHCYYFVLENDSLRTATIFRPYFRLPATSL